jgi:hypothetical protein
MTEISQDDHDAAYLKAIRASERLRDDRQKAADQAHADVIAQADHDCGANTDRVAGPRNRDRTYALASDGRQGIYDRAAQDHFDRRAALAVHFGQAIRARGNPDAPHAQAWLASLDVDAFRADPEPSPIGSPVMAEHHPGMPVPRRIDERGIIVAETFTPGDGGRGTFRGDAAAARRFATMTQRERAEAAAWVVEQAQSVTADVSDTSAAAPEPTPAPPGLLDDIRKALGR